MSLLCYVQFSLTVSDCFGQVPRKGCIQGYNHSRNCRKRSHFLSLCCFSPLPPGSARYTKVKFFSSSAMSHLARMLILKRIYLYFNEDGSFFPFAKYLPNNAFSFSSIPPSSLVNAGI